MNTKLLQKSLAALALAGLLLPVAASAHGLGLNLGGGLNLGSGEKDKTEVEGNGSVNVHANAKVEKHDNKGEHKDRVEGTKNASTTAAVIVKKANRISTVADLMASMSTTLGTKITNSTVADKTALNAKLADFNTVTAGAKTQAAAAVATAGQINANASSTVNASFITAAQANLKAARDFLHQARLDISAILRALW